MIPYNEGSIPPLPSEKPIVIPPGDQGRLRDLGLVKIGGLVASGLVSPVDAGVTTV
jgi:hypothetical protein